MLCLSRKLNESIVIGGNIRVMVIGIRGDKVRLGVDAPLEVSVDRSEVHDEKEAEKQAESQKQDDARKQIEAEKNSVNSNGKDS